MIFSSTKSVMVFFLKYKLHIAVGIILFYISIVTFLPLFGIVFSNSDDMDTALLDLSNRYWQIGWRWATYHGRIQPLFTAHIYAFTAHRLGVGPLVDAFQFLPWIVAGLLSGFAFGRFLGRPMLGALFVVLFFGMMPFGGRYSAVVGYPSMFSAPIAIFILALILLDRFIGKPGKLIGSATVFCLWFAYNSHETMSVGFLILACGLVFARQRDSLSADPPRSAWALVLAPFAVYATGYLVWRQLYPSSYQALETPQFNTEWLAGWLKTTAYFVRVSFPLGLDATDLRLIHLDSSTETTLVEQAPSGFGAITGFVAQDLTRLMPIAAVMIATLAIRVPRHRRRYALGLALVSMAALVMSQSIVAVSSSYQAYVAGGYAPIHVAAFGYFVACGALFGFWIWLETFLTSPLAFMAGRFLAIAIVLAGSAAAGVSQRSQADELHANSARWRAVRALTTAQAWRALPTNADVLAPGLFYQAGVSVIPRQNDYWTQYLEKIDGSRINFIAKRDTAPPSARMDFNCADRLACVAMLRQRHADGTCTLSVASTGERLLTTWIGTSTIYFLPPGSSVLGQPHIQVEWSKLGRIHRAEVAIPGVDCGMDTPPVWRSGGKVTSSQP